MGLATIWAWIFLIHPASAAPQVFPLQEIDRRYQAAKTVDQLRDVEGLIRKNIEASGVSGELALRLAKTYFSLGKQTRNGEAKKYFSQCVDRAELIVKLNPKFAAGYFFRGLCNGKLGQLKGLWASLKITGPLKRDMETTIKLDPSISHGGPHRALGKLYHDLPGFMGGSLDKSIHHYRQALRYGPDFADNHFYLAEAYFSKEDYDRARKHLEAVLRITQNNMEDADLREIRGRALDLLKTLDDASGL